MEAAPNNQRRQVAEKKVEFQGGNAQVNVSISKQPAPGSVATGVDCLTLKRAPNLSWLLCAATLLFIASPLSVVYTDALLAKRFAAGVFRGDVRRIVELSEAFGHGGAVMLILLTIGLANPSRVRQIAIAAAGVLSAGLYANLIKLTLARSRPHAWNGENIYASFQGWFPGKLEYALQSFPSGHTATAFGLAVGLSWQFPTAAPMFYFFATLTALQRMHGQAHFLSDVLCGAAVGIACSAVTIRALCNAPWNFKNQGLQIDSSDPS